MSSAGGARAALAAVSVASVAAADCTMRPARATGVGVTAAAIPSAGSAVPVPAGAEIVPGSLPGVGSLERIAGPGSASAGTSAVASSPASVPSSAAIGSPVAAASSLATW